MTKKKRKKKNSSKVNWLWFNLRIRIILTLFLGVVILGLVFNPSMFTGGDNAQYITLAKSILKGEYRNLAFIGQPVEIEIPPGYPLLIVPLIRMFPNSFIPAKILSFIAMLFGICISLLLFDKYKIPRLAGFLFSLSLLANSVFNEFSHWTLTEAPYFAMSIFGVYIFDKYYDSEEILKFVLASVIIFLTMYIRPVAIPLVVGIFVFLLVIKMFKRAATFALIGIFVYGPWFVRTILVRKGSEESFYLINFFGQNTVGNADTPGLLAKVFSNLNTYLFRDLPTVFTSVSGKTGILYATIGVLATLLVTTGIIILFIRKKTFLPYYVLLYFGMLLIYNPRFATFRYLMPIIPIILISIWIALGVKKPDLSRYSPTIITVVSALMLLLSIISYVPVAKANNNILRQYFAGNKYAGLPHIVWLRFIEACGWIEQNTPEDARLISRKPRISYILSERPGKVYEFTNNPSTIISDIDSVGADYVIVDRISGTTQAYLIPAIQAYPHRFEVVYKTAEPATYVLKVLPPGTPPPQRPEPQQEGKE